MLAPEGRNTMTCIPVYYQVHMSYSHKEPESKSIGTDGLGPCLGIIIRAKGQVFCGHMSCEIVPMGDGVKKIHQIASRLLIIQNLKPIDSIYFASGSPRDKTTKTMHAAINEVLGTDADLQTGFGIYWKDGKVGVLPKVTDSVLGTVKSPRDPTQPNTKAGPFNVR